MTIVWSQAALRDLDEIAAYIADTEPRAAQRVVERLMASVATYSRFPGMGRIGPVDGTREIVVARLPYIITYRVQVDVFEVLGIRHGAQQGPR